MQTISHRRGGRKGTRAVTWSRRNAWRARFSSFISTNPKPVGRALPLPFAARVGSLTESTEPRPIVFSKTDCSDVDAVLKLMFFTNSVRPSSPSPPTASSSSSDSDPRSAAASSSLPSLAGLSGTARAAAAAAARGAHSRKSGSFLKFL